MYSSQKKRLYAPRALFLVLMTALLASLSTAFATDVAGVFRGSGTLVDPYLINTLDDLRQFRDIVDSGETFRGRYFAQTADLTFPNGENWNPIGDVSPLLPFRGYYDGCGHTISNINSNHPFAGVFSYLDGEVRNLGIESGHFEGDTVGSITSHGSTAAKIINCYNKAEVVGVYRAGGLADNFPGTILFSWNLGEVQALSADAIVAGIVSYGATKLNYSYSTLGPLTNKRTFNGEVTESYAVTEADIAGRLNAIKQLINAEKPESILRGGVAIMQYRLGNLSFADYTSVEERYLQIMEERFNFEGEGTEKNPFLIASVDDLKRMRDSVNYGENYLGYYFRQTENLVFPDDENWIPIGNVKELLAFCGTYDGGGHTIENIRSVNQYAGLFAYLCGEVRNLGIESGHFEGDTVGSITSHGNDKGLILNCYNKAEVSGTYRAGGLTDNFAGRILFSWNRGWLSPANENTVTAGITSYGNATIQYTYTTTGDPVNPDTFTGNLTETARISVEEIPQRIETAYAAMANQDKRLISSKNIVFLIFSEGSLIFSDTVPALYSFNLLKRYIPLMVLAVAAVVVFVALLITRKRRARRRKAAAQQAQESASGESDIGPEPTDAKTWGKRLLSMLLTIAILCASCNYAFGILTYKYQSGIVPMRYWKNSENNATDILLIGNSRLAINMDIADLWKYHGIAAFCIGAGEAMMENNYYRLIEACKSRVPPAVLLEVSVLTNRNNHIDIAQNRISNYGAMFPSLNKLRYVNATLAMEDRMNYFMGFPVFHNRYFDLNFSDFQSANEFGKHNKGGWGIYVAGPVSQTDEESASPIALLNSKDEYYLRKVISFCIEKGISIVLVASPIYLRNKYRPELTAIEIIAKEYGVPFLDMNQHLGEADISDRNFASDAVHLNLKGARNFAEFLGNYLHDELGFSSHMGMVGYQTWNYFVQEQENFDLRVISDNSDYFAELARDGRRLFLIPHKIPEPAPPALQAVLASVDALPHESLENGSASLQEGNLTVRQGDASCELLLNGKSVASASNPGALLVVYDEILGQVADIAEFSSGNDYSVRHLYAPAVT